MSNAFENAFSQAKKEGKKDKANVDISTSQHTAKAPKKKSSVNIATSKQNNKATKQHVDISTSLIQVNGLKTTGDLERKTVYLKPEIIEIFKYAKYKEKIGESQFANVALENYIIHKYGKNWKELIK